MTILTDNNCSDGTITASSNNAVVPDTGILVFILTTGPNLLVINFSFADFPIDDPETYRIHAAIVPNDFDPAFFVGLPLDEMITLFEEEAPDVCFDVDETGVSFSCCVAEYECEAEAGSLGAIPETVCFGEQFTVTANGFNPDSDYLQAYLLTYPFDPVNGLTQLIIHQISYSGLFVADTVGTFSIMAVNILAAQIPVPLDYVINLDVNICFSPNFIPCFDNDVAVGTDFITILEASNSACGTSPEPFVGTSIVVNENCFNQSLEVYNDGAFVPSSMQLFYLIFNENSDLLLDYSSVTIFTIPALGTYNVHGLVVPSDFDPTPLIGLTADEIITELNTQNIPYDFEEQGTTQYCDYIENCIADAGSICEIPDTVCLGDEFSIIASAFNLDTTYVQAYLLTDPYDPSNGQTTLTIFDVSTDGVFTANEVGTYSIMTINFPEEFTPSESIIGMDAGLMEMAISCFDSYVAVGQDFITIMDSNSVSCDPNYCGAFAGTTTLIDDCADGEITVENTGTIVPNSFILVYLLTESTNNLILYFQFGGNFDFTEGGDYQVYSAVVPNSFDPTPFIGIPFEEMLTTLEEDTLYPCYDFDETGVSFSCVVEECIAEAGIISEIPDTVCLGDEFSIVASGFNTDTSYIQEFLLTAPLDIENGQTILSIFATSIDGIFTANLSGTYSIMAVNFPEEQTPLDIPPNSDANLLGTVISCFDSYIAEGENFITILPTDDPFCFTCTANAGIIYTPDSTTVCAGDTIPDIINVLVEGTEGENQTFIVTNEDASIFLRGPNPEGIFDFNDFPLGVNKIWGLTYDGEIGLPALGESFNIAGDCFELSNSIEILNKNCPPIGIENVLGTEDKGILSIFPMPSSEVLSVTFNNQSNNPIFTIYDSTAKEIKSVDKNVETSGKNTISINISHLSSGLYFLQLKDAHSTDVIKFVKE